MKYFGIICFQNRYVSFICFFSCIDVLSIEQIGEGIIEKVHQIKKIWDYLKKNYDDKSLSEACAIYIAYLFYLENDTEQGHRLLEK
jgi:hypothetical protein